MEGAKLGLSGCHTGHISSPEGGSPCGVSVLLCGGVGGAKLVVLVVVGPRSALSKLCWRDVD